MTFTIIPQDEAAVFSSLGGTVTFTEDGGAIALDSDALIVDDDAVYTQSTFNLTISGSDVTEDLISFSLGGISHFENGSNVECNEGSGATVLGAITGTATNKTVTMASSGVTEACVQALFQSVRLTTAIILSLFLISAL